MEEAELPGKNKVSPSAKFWIRKAMKLFHILSKLRTSKQLLTSKDIVIFVKMKEEQ